MAVAAQGRQRGLPPTLYKDSSKPMAGTLVRRCESASLSACFHEPSSADISGFHVGPVTLRVGTVEREFEGFSLSLVVAESSASDEQTAHACENALISTIEPVKDDGLMKNRRDSQSSVQV